MGDDDAGGVLRRAGAGRRDLGAPLRHLVGEGASATSPIGSPTGRPISSIRPPACPTWPTSPRPGRSARRELPLTYVLDPTSDLDGVVVDVPAAAPRRGRARRARVAGARPPARPGHRADPLAPEGPAAPPHPRGRGGRGGARARSAPRTGRCSRRPGRRADRARRARRSRHATSTWRRCPTTSASPTEPSTTPVGRSPGARTSPRCGAGSPSGCGTRWPPPHRWPRCTAPPPGRSARSRRRSRSRTPATPSPGTLRSSTRATPSASGCCPPSTRRAPRCGAAPDGSSSCGSAHRCARSTGRCRRATKLALGASDRAVGGRRLPRLRGGRGRPAAGGARRSGARRGRRSRTLVAAVRLGFAGAAVRLAGLVAEAARPRRRRSTPRSPRCSPPPTTRRSSTPRAHLDRLLRRGWIADAGYDQLPDVARYLRALEHRVQKARTEPDRDRRHIAGIQELEREYRRVAARDATGEVRTMLEELRVSTFAQAVGRQGRRERDEGPPSPRRWPESQRLCAFRRMRRSRAQTSSAGWAGAGEAGALGVDRPGGRRVPAVVVDELAERAAAHRAVVARRLAQRDRGGDDHAVRDAEQRRAARPRRAGATWSSPRRSRGPRAASSRFWQAG